MTAHRILVADDDLTEIFLLQFAFARAGIEVDLEFVRDGEEVIDYLEGRNDFVDRQRFPFPELLLLDLKMPKLDGFEVLSWLRQQPGLKRMIVVVLTCSDEPEDIDHAYELGANSYIVKPPDMEDLYIMARRIQEYWVDLSRCPSCSVNDRNLGRQLGA